MKLLEKYMVNRRFKKEGGKIKTISGNLSTFIIFINIFFGLSDRQMDNLCIEYKLSDQMDTKRNQTFILNSIREILVLCLYIKPYGI